MNWQSTRVWRASLPIANRFTRALLRSRWHRPASSTMMVLSPSASTVSCWTPSTRAAGGYLALAGAAQRPVARRAAALLAVAASRPSSGGLGGAPGGRAMIPVRAVADGPILSG
jgi:hypothetical protein